MRNLKRAMTTAAVAALVLPVAAHGALMGEWTMEEGTGNTITESITGTVSDAFGSGVSFSNDTAAPGSSFSLSLDGRNGVTTNVTGADVGLPGTGARTIVTWFKTSASTATPLDIFSYSPTGGEVPGADLRLRLDNGKLRLEVSGGFARYDGSADLRDGAWHVIAAVIPDSASTSDVDFYIDGSLFDQDSIGGTDRVIDTAASVMGTNPDNTTEIWIGDTNVTNANVFNGLIDDVRVYDQALTLGELDSLRTTGVIPAPTSIAVLGPMILVMLRRRRA